MQTYGNERAIQRGEASGTLAKVSAVDREILRLEKSGTLLHEALSELDARLANVSHPQAPQSLGIGAAQPEPGCSSTLQGRLSTTARQIEAAHSRIRGIIEQLDI